MGATKCWRAGPCRTDNLRCSPDVLASRVRDNVAMNDADYMGLALQEAQAAHAAGEVPVGAVVVREPTGTPLPVRKRPLPDGGALQAGGLA